MNLPSLHVPNYILFEDIISHLSYAEAMPKCLHRDTSLNHNFSKHKNV